MAVNCWPPPLASRGTPPSYFKVQRTKSAQPSPREVPVSTVHYHYSPSTSSGPCRASTITALRPDMSQVKTQDQSTRTRTTLIKIKIPLRAVRGVLTLNVKLKLGVITIQLKQPKPAYTVELNPRCIQLED
jgi:hypothetical protein